MSGISKQLDTYQGYKIVIFGDGGVGKTTLITKYVSGVFNENTLMTIGVDFHVKKLEIDNHKVSLQIWDFAGEDRFRFLAPLYLKGAEAGAFMFDLTRIQSLENVEAWMEVISETSPKLPIILIGGKLDITNTRAVSSDYAEDVVDAFNFSGYLECSSKTGENIDEIFTHLARIVLTKKKLI